MPAEGLLHHSGDVRQAVLVGVVGEAMVTYDAIDLLLTLLLDFGVQDHGQQERLSVANGLQHPVRFSTCIRQIDGAGTYSVETSCTQEGQRNVCLGGR